MNKEEAIKYLQQLYPNGGHCWLDEQRLEAIRMAIQALQEEPISTRDKLRALSDGKQHLGWLDDARKVEEGPVSEELEEAMQHNAPDNIGVDDLLYWRNGFITCAKWKVDNLWKPADGEDLPEYDREVIVLIKYNTQRNIHDEEYPTYRVGFGHRPDPKGWEGKSVTTGKVEHYTPKTYDKGGWNMPDVVLWLDLDIPKIEED